MSGGHHHHPHGRQGQPNPAWNPLQLPNYFPVRPQIAHMSSERPLAHSPPTWHTPTPPEHQKNAPNPYRHTPTPPDVQALKAASTLTLPYRHTPTPPDLKSFRHTPTPPDVAHTMKTSGVLHYRHTPTPPDVHKGAASPIFNLQQMISDTRATPRDSLRDNMGFSRHSPGLTHGSMDLSVTRSPRNGSQNGETTAPISLSVRDATKINSLDSAEISKLHQPLLFTGKPLDMKPSSPTVNSMSQRSNSPKSPLASSKKPVKNVASILERLNSVGDGVVITPVQHTPSPQSVIVSAHSLEDSNSRGSSSSSVNITHMTGITPHYTCEAANMERISPPTPPSLPHPHPHPLDEAAALSIMHHPPPAEVSPKILTEIEQTQPLPVPQSVIKESLLIRKDDSPSLANENSNDSSTSESGRLKKKRKQARKSIEGDPTTDNTHQATEDNVREEADVPTLAESTPANTMVNKLIEQLPVTNDPPTIIVNTNDATANGIPPVEDKMEMNDPVSVVSKTRRKNSSESETIDNIAAMIASTENASNICFPKKPISEISAERDPNLSIMHTEQLKEVLGSPTEHPSDMASSPNQKEAAAVPEPVTLAKQRKKRLSRSQSVEISQNETSKTSTDVTDQGTAKKAKPDFVEVENELEKMFAGIEQSEPTLTPQVTNATPGLPSDTAQLESNNNDKKKASQRNNRAARRASIGATQVTVSSDESTPKKKKNSKKNKSLNESTPSSTNKKKRSLGTPNTPNKKLKRDKSADKSKLEILSHKDAYDSGSNASSSKSRGPYVQIKGPRDSPLSVSVINTPIVEEDGGDKPLQKVKTLKSKSSLNSDSDFKNKVKSKGLHSSTLSMKYDATNIDTSWICVFCKRGPHTGGSAGNAKQMGDLFGPYIVTTQCADFNCMINDPQDTVFKNKVKPGTFSQNKQAKPHGRKNKVEVETTESKPLREDIYFGMTEAGSNSYEVWFHEDCAVWAPGLYLVGTKIVGLDSAVWGSCTVKCDVCKMTGACIACIKRGCLKSMHVNCARTDTWTLNENTFRVYCTEHAPTP